MATSGIITKVLFDKVKIQLRWYAKQNLKDNTSYVTADLYFVDDGYSADTNVNYSITIEDTTHTKSYHILTSGGKTIKLGSLSKTLNHNNDGTRKFKLSGYVDFRSTNISGHWLYKEYLDETTFTLTQIDRFATGKLHDFTIGNTITLDITNPSSSNYLIAELFINGEYISDFQDGIKASGTYTMGLNSTQISKAYSVSPYSTSPKAEVKIYNYRDSARTEWIGTTVATAKAYIPSSIIPSIGNISISEANPKNDTGYYIMNISNLKLHLDSYNPGEGAKVQTYSHKGINWQIFNGSKKVWDKLGNDAIVPALNIHGDITIRCSFTDSRFRTVETTKSIHLLTYSQPSISNIKIARSTAFGSEKITGTYANIKGKIGGATVNGTNPLQIKIETKTSDSSTWTTKTSFSLTSLEWNVNYDLERTISSFDISSSYDIKITISDKFNNAIFIGSIVSAMVQIAFGKKNVGFGGFPDSESGNCAEFFNNVGLDGVIKPLEEKTLKAVLLANWTGNLYYQKDALGNAHVWGTIKPGTVSKWTTISKLGSEYGLTGVSRTVIPIYKTNDSDSRSGLNLAISSSGQLYVVDTTDLKSNDEIEINHSYHVDGGW